MLGQRNIDAAILEWWTGLDAQGKESPFAGWMIVAGMRARVIRVSMLQAMLARAWGGANYVRARLALGADGAAVVRLEFEDGAHVINVQRWRPTLPDVLDGVVDSDNATPCARKVLVMARSAADASALMPVDPATMPDTGAAIATLKLDRTALVDRREAGDPNAQTNIDAVTNKLAAIRTEHDKRVALAKQQVPDVA